MRPSIPCSTSIEIQGVSAAAGSYEILRIHISHKKSNTLNVQLHSLSNSLISTSVATNITSSLGSLKNGAEVSELDRSGTDSLLGGGDVQTPTTGRVTDITGMGSPRPSFSTFGGMGLASPFAGGDAGEGGEKQRRFEGENKCGNFIVDL